MPLKGPSSGSIPGGTREGASWAASAASAARPIPMAGIAPAIIPSALLREIFIYGISCRASGGRT